MSVLANLQFLVNRVRGTMKGHGEEIEYGWIAEGMKDHYCNLVKMIGNVLYLVEYKFSTGIIMNSTKHNRIYWNSEDLEPPKLTSSAAIYLPEECTETSWLALDLG